MGGMLLLTCYLVESTHLANSHLPSLIPTRSCRCHQLSSRDYRMLRNRRMHTTWKSYWSVIGTMTPIISASPQGFLLDMGCPTPPLATRTSRWGAILKPQVQQYIFQSGTLVRHQVLRLRSCTLASQLRQVSHHVS